MKTLLFSLAALTPLALIGCTDKVEDTGTTVVEADADGDGFANADAGGNDCDDSDPEVYPGAEENLTDGIDNNCDGEVDVPTTDTTDTPGTTDTTEDLECGGTAPVVETFVVEPYEQNGNPYIFFGLVVTDEDADLDRYEFSAWFDTTIDGSVDSSVDRQLSYAPTETGAECNEDYIELNLITPEVGVGDPPTLEWSTLYEFGVAVSDAEGLLSNVAIGEATTQDDPDAEPPDTGDTGTDTGKDTGKDTGPDTGDTGTTKDTGKADTGGTTTDPDTGGGVPTDPDTGDTGASSGGGVD